MKAIVLPVILSSVVPAWGQSTGTLTYSQVTSAVEAANPELSSARARARAERAKVFSAWAPEGPVLELERAYAPTGSSPLSGPEKVWGLSQELDFPAATWLKRRAAAAMAEAAAQEAEAVRCALRARARAAYAALRLVWVERDLIAQNIEILRRVARVAEAKLSAGKAGQADALKAQMELSRMQGLLEFKEHETPVAEAELSALMGRAPGPLPRPESGSEAPIPALADLQRLAAEFRPERRAAFVAARQARAESALAKAELFPKVMLQYRRRTEAMRGPTHDAVAGLSLPLWGGAATAVGASRAAAAAADGARAVDLDTLAGVAVAHGHWSSAARLAEVYRTAVLPQAEAALRTAEAAYQADRGGFLDLLDAQRSLLEMTMEHERLRAEATKSRGELERMVGREL